MINTHITEEALQEITNLLNQAQQQLESTNGVIQTAVDEEFTNSGNTLPSDWSAEIEQTKKVIKDTANSKAQVLADDFRNLGEELKSLQREIETYFNNMKTEEAAAAKAFNE